jgi:Lrp/AsnC family transcriptional regulator, regulator for asnA, asnC and gidA
VSDHGTPPGVELDAIDYQIMDRLKEDGRRSNASISRALGISQSTVKKRIDRLIKLRIMRVLAVVDPIAFGHEQHMMVGINVRPGTATSVGETLAVLPEVAFLAYLVGRYDIWMEVFAPNLDRLLQVFSERLAGLSDIVRMETFAVARYQRVDYYNWSVPLGADKARIDKRSLEPATHDNATRRELP